MTEIATGITGGLGLLILSMLRPSMATTSKATLTATTRSPAFGR